MCVFIKSSIKHACELLKYLMQLFLSNNYLTCVNLFPLAWATSSSTYWNCQYLVEAVETNDYNNPVQRKITLSSFDNIYSIQVLDIC